MTNIRSSKAAKIIALVVLVIMMLTTILTAWASLFMATEDVYADGGILWREEVAELIFYQKVYRYHNYAVELLYNSLSDVEKESYEVQFSENNCNLSVTASAILDNGEKTLFKNYENGEYQYKFESYHQLYSDITDNSYEMEVIGYIVITAYLQEDYTAKDEFYYGMKFVDFLIGSRFVFIYIAAGALIISLAMMIFLITSAGHRKDSAEIELNWFDKLPFELILGAYFLIGLFTWLLYDEVFYHEDILLAMYVAVMIFVWLALIIKLLMTVAVRIKARVLWKNTLVCQILRLGWKGIKLTVHVIERIPLFWKTALVFIAWTVIEFIFLAGGKMLFVVFWIITRPLILILLIYFVLMLRRLQKAGEELERGNTNYRVDTKYMPSDIKRHGENLNNLSVGLNRAVEERMKSERMKSELITNVSHDIKTPLTSIINYVDLLKMNGLDSPDAMQYLEVLDHQSARLKKLTEDLIEASKASSGCITPEPEPTDVNVLLAQALGEYEENLRAAGIDPILRLCHENPMILADGRLLWRVFDNLFSNIKKYAPPSTRAYFSSHVDDNVAVIVFRNISSAPLDIDGDELTERFVRGDTSRHTEGSGLGLSIARSLTELQGGGFNITIDGDLFKVTITFPIYPIM